MRLEGFISNSDVNTIKLTKGNAVLEYSSPNVGENIPIILDSRFPGRFFELTGYNNINYKIDQESLVGPQGAGILGDILPRPLNVAFYTVCKEYDGTAIFDKEYLRYKLMPTSDNESGLISGSDNDYKYLKMISTGIKARSEMPAPEGYRSVWSVVGLEYSGQDTRGDADSMQTELILTHENNKWKSELRTPQEVWGSRFSFPVCVDKNTGVFRLKVREPGYISDIANPAGRYRIQPDTDSVYTPYNIELSPETKVPNIGLEIELEQQLISLQTDSIENPVGKRFIKSDIGRVLVDVSHAEAPSKNISSHPVPLSYVDACLVDGIISESERGVSKNYKIAQLVGYGHIYPRKSAVHVKASSKVYDGTDKIDYKLYSIDRYIEGDSLHLDYETPSLKWSSKNVGSYPVSAGRPNITGDDANNYSFKNVTYVDNAEEVQILPREVQCTLSTLRIHRQSQTIQCKYTLCNTISGDDVWISLKNCTITLHSKSQGDILIENLFTGDYIINSNQIKWATDSNGREIASIYITSTDSDKSFCISDQDSVTLHNIQLKGSDKDNYKLIETNYGPININIVNVR